MQDSSIDVSAPRLVSPLSQVPLADVYRAVPAGARSAVVRRRRGKISGRTGRAPQTGQRLATPPHPFRSSPPSHGDLYERRYTPHISRLTPAVGCRSGLCSIRPTSCAAAISGSDPHGPLAEPATVDHVPTMERESPHQRCLLHVHLL